MRIRPAQITNDPFSYWANDIRNSINEKNISVSSDLLIVSTPYGSRISLPNKTKFNPNYTNYVGEWNITSSYSINDMVRVLPGKKYDYPWTRQPTVVKDVDPVTYDNDNGVMLLGGQVTVNDQIYDYIIPNFTPIPGVYVCVANVPWWGVGTTFALIPAKKEIEFDNLPPFVQSTINYFRFIDVNYFPVWPELPNKAEFDPDDLSKFKGRYWELISLLPSPTLSCVNNVTTTEYADTQMIPTGSSNYTGSY